MKSSKILFVIATTAAIIVAIFLFTKNERNNPTSGAEVTAINKQGLLPESNSPHSEDLPIERTPSFEDNIKAPAQQETVDALYTETKIINGKPFLLDILDEGYDENGMWFRTVRNEQGTVHTLRREENPIHKQAEYGYDLDMNAPEYSALDSEQLKLAAANGDKVAQLIVTHRAYKEGNDVEGKEHLLNSAAGGMTRGITLAAMVQSSTKPIDALALALVARKRGDASIITFTKNLTNQLTPEQQEQAQNLSEDLYEELLELRNKQYGSPFGT